MLLEVLHMSVFYDKAMLHNDVNLGVDEGELVSLVGPNGAGKSTLLRAITGLVARDREISKRSTGGEVILKGKIRFAGEEIQGVPAYQIVKRGLVHCPERRRPFREMAVRDNLLAGAYLKRDRVAKASDLEKVYTLFPVLKGRSSQVAGTLSGGEQQMLAIGRALMTEPKLLCIDEPSTGLAPILRKEVFTKIKEVSLLGITVLLVEQEVSAVFEMASRNYVLSSGRIIAEGTAESLLKDEVIRKTYLGL